jgi:hypothetical protein
LATIADEKKTLWNLYDAGEVNTVTLQSGIDALYQREQEVHFSVLESKMLKSLRGSRMRPRIIAASIGAAFLVGFFVSPFLYPRLFGYRNAAECLLHNSNRYGAEACDDLYPKKTVSAAQDMPGRE